MTRSIFDTNGIPYCSAIVFYFGTEFIITVQTVRTKLIPLNQAFYVKWMSNTCELVSL